MAYYIGIDGGGTKTDVLICNEYAQVMAAGHSGASSVTGQTPEKAFDQLSLAIHDALKALPTPPTSDGGESIRACYAGISGGGLGKNRRMFLDMLRKLLPDVKKLDCSSDAANALSSGIGLEDGVVAIAGTGSSVFARKAGVLHQVGGWGYLIGDEGSGYDLGRRAVQCAFQCFDGRGPQTSLLALCKEKIGPELKNLTDWVPILYENDAKTLLASFAPLLLHAAEQGDSVALAQLKESTKNMAAAIRTAAAWGKSKKVVLAGSIWKNELYKKMTAGALKCGGSFSEKGIFASSELQTTAAAASEKEDVAFTLIRPTLPPVCGSVALAWALDGRSCSADWQKIMEKSL